MAKDAGSVAHHQRAAEKHFAHLTYFTLSNKTSGTLSLQSPPTPSPPPRSRVRAHTALHLGSVCRRPSGEVPDLLLLTGGSRLLRRDKEPKTMFTVELHCMAAIGARA